MKFYIIGKKIRDVGELEAGKVYSVAGICGEYVPPVGPDCVCEFKNKEEFMELKIAREPLIDRINMGYVYVVKKSWNPRPKTILKMMEQRKK